MQDRPAPLQGEHPLPLGPRDFDAALAIINAAAEAYSGRIPEDCWHDPYMKAAELRDQLDDGVQFSGLRIGGALVAVMGVQAVANVHLIRHAYVRPERQGLGLGSRLIAHLCRRVEAPILIGTWRAASWAISFYERHGFSLVPGPATPLLLRTYWTIPERQLEASVVLARPSLDERSAADLVARGAGVARESGPAG